MPRMTTVQRTAIVTPANGLQVYDTTTNSQWFYNGTVWVQGASKADGSKWTNDATNTRIALTNLSDGTTARPAGTEFVIKDNGRIGIGTTTPTDCLDIVSNTYATINLRSHVTSDTEQGALVFKKNRNLTEGVNTATLDGDYLGQVGWNGNTGNGFRQGAFIYGIQSGNVGANFVPTDIRFDTSNGVASAASRMIIKNNGNIGINTLIPSTKLDIRGTNELMRLFDDFESDLRLSFGTLNDGAGNYYSYIKSIVNSNNIENGRLILNPSAGGVGIGNDGLSIGNTYKTINAPIQGAIIEGNVGIGVNLVSDYKLRVGKGLKTGINNIAAFGTTDANPQILLIQNNLDNGIIVQSTNSGIANNNIFLNKHGGNVAIGDVTPTEKLEVDGAIKIGTTSTATPTAGTIRFNTTTNKFQGYDGTVWQDLH